MPAGQSALLLGPEHSLRWGSHSMSSCDGVSPIVVRAGAVHPEGVTCTPREGSCQPITQGTSPRTCLFYAVSCGTKKYLSIFFRAGEGVPNVVMVLLQFWVSGSLHYGTHTYMHTYMHSYIHTPTHSYIHTFIHSYIHSFIHTYVHTYIHTYVPACMHACMHR